MKSARISVIVPVYNGAQTIGDMLQALRAQIGARDAEIIVVDNGSTDNTVSIVREHAVTLLHEPRRGPAAARNCGLRRASGDIIVHLDADTLPTRRWLSNLVSVFDDPNVTLAVGRTLTYLPTTPEERFVAAAGLNDERAIYAEAFPFAPSLNMAVRREAALAVGGWAEDMPTAEDVEFSHRVLRLCRTPISFRPNAVLFHRSRTTIDTLRKQAWTYGQGAAHMYRRHPDVARWDFAKSMRLAWIVGARTALPLLLVAGNWIGRATADQVEFARFHRFWTWWYWRGFFDMYRRGVRREL